LSVHEALAIFDLDGTLIDSKRDLVDSVNATLDYMGRHKLAEAVISSYVGNGAPILIQRALGDEATQEQVAQGLAFFLGYYREHKLDYTKLYPGVQEALDLLRDQGVRLAVLTNKPVRASVDIVAGLGLGDYFLRVYGGNSFPTKKPDPQGLQTIVQEIGAPLHRTAMIGDSHVDMETARNAGVAAYGIRFGFQADSFHRVAPDHVFDDMPSLARHFLEAHSAR
jgi:phosphoglycolate phosphatase